jgi:glycosyltransferase involved in cell wall biosynthesis
MPVWQKAADVLVIPNTAKEKISKYYTSPMKLFEYLASEKPIAASNIPSIKEIYESEPVHFFNPDDAVSLANIINSILTIEYNKNEYSSPRKFIKYHSWVNRAKRIENSFRAI